MARPFMLEKDRRQRRQSEMKRMGLEVPAEGRSLAPALVALAAAAVVLRVGVEDFPPETAARHAHADVVPRHGSEVEHGEDEVAGALRLAQEAERALVGIVGVHPLEARGSRVALVERGFVAIEPVQMADEFLTGRCARLPS